MWEWLRQKLWIVTGTCFAAGTTAIQVREYFVAAVLFFASGASLVFFGIGWPGIQGHATITRVAKTLLVLIGVVLIPFSWAWVVRQKGNDPWTVFLKDDHQEIARNGVNVVFSDSPYLTLDRKARIQSQVQTFYAYLGAFRFKTPKQTGSLNVDDGSRGYVGEGYSGAVVPGESSLSDSIILPAKLVDDSSEIIAAYSWYAFSKILAPTYPYSDSNLRVDAVAIIATYFASDYLEKEIVRGNQKWTSALWEIRAKFGRQMVSRSLFFQVEAMNDKIANGAYYTDFDHYMSWYFDRGELALGSSAERFIAVDEILQKHKIATVR